MPGMVSMSRNAGTLNGSGFALSKASIARFAVTTHSRAAGRLNFR